VASLASAVKAGVVAEWAGVAAAAPRPRPPLQRAGAGARTRGGPEPVPVAGSGLRAALAGRTGKAGGNQGAARFSETDRFEQWWDRNARPVHAPAGAARTGSYAIAIEGAAEPGARSDVPVTPLQTLHAALGIYA
jgi:hypothetical protein